MNCEYTAVMVIKPQDVLVVFKLAFLDAEEWRYSDLAEPLGISPSELHNSVQRSLKSGLLFSGEAKPKVNRSAFLEFVVHGLKYVFVPEVGGIVRGMPTAHAAPPLGGEIVSDGLPPVWPDPSGPVQGVAFKPIYKSVVMAAQNDSKLYKGLALVDAIRGGRARERKLAKGHLKEMLAV